MTADALTQARTRLADLDAERARIATELHTLDYDPLKALSAEEVASMRAGAYAGDGRTPHAILREALAREVNTRRERLADLDRERDAAQAALRAAEEAARREHVAGGGARLSAAQQAHEAAAREHAKLEAEQARVGERLVEIKKLQEASAADAKTYQKYERERIDLLSEQQRLTLALPMAENTMAETKLALRNAEGAAAALAFEAQMEAVAKSEAAVLEALSVLRGAFDELAHAVGLAGESRSGFVSFEGRAAYAHASSLVEALRKPLEKLSEVA